MKKSLILAGMLSIGYAYAQEGRVGINTEDPKATLDIKSVTNDEAKGILTPQLTGDALKTMTSGLTADQHGLLTYATSGVATVDEATTNVQFPGYHRFNIDGTTKSWVRMEPSGLEKIKGEGDNIGYRLIGHNGNTKYATIGYRAIDLGFATDNNTEIGPTGSYAVVMGPNNKATNWGAFAFGEKLTASGKASVAMGLGSVASGDYSFTMGYNNQSVKMGAVSFGNSSKALDTYSFAAGLASQATKPYSISIGYNNKSEAEASVALGASNTVKGTRAIALGNTNTVSGQASFSAGFYNQVLANYGVAIGFKTISSVEGMVAIGSSNTSGGKLFVIGNGNRATDDTLIERSDAFTVLHDARVGIDIDNFETTTSDAKLQVNGKILSSSLASAGSGNRPVYADENGVLVIGTGSTATTTGATTLSGEKDLKCDSTNRGKMNFVKNDSGSDVFGICMRNEDGNYYWGLLIGGGNLTTGGETFFGE